MEKEASFFSVDFLLVVAALLSIALVGYNAFLLPDYAPPAVSYRSQAEAPMQAPAATEDGAGEAASVFTVNVNTANSEELQRVPGIGPAMAEKIIEYRERVGVIIDLSELLEVSGIGEKKLEQFTQYLVLEG